MLGLNDWYETLALRAQEMKAGRKNVVHRRLDEETVPPKPKRISADYCYQLEQWYCSFTQDCIVDCVECGWHTATDIEAVTCVAATIESCRKQGKIYCESDDSCHPFGDCEACAGKPISDYAQGKCLAAWWNEASPDVSTWVCRSRHKCGRKCVFDQDCLYGLKRCINEKCAPLSLKKKDASSNAQLCAGDEDCPHLGYYCPTSTDPFYDRVCQPQKLVGEKCAANTDTIECVPEARCNTGEVPHRCRQLFSLTIGELSSDPVLCTFSVTENGKCSVAVQSKSVSQPCVEDTDCPTTGNSTGVCVCKAWWDSEDARYCMPVAGDFRNHNEALRDLMWFVAKNCGSFWTEAECLDEFVEARRLKLALDCETQTLSGGPYLPPTDCNLRDGNELMGRKWTAMTDTPLFVDSCLELERMMGDTTEVKTDL